MTAVEQLRSEFFSYAEHCPRSIEEEKWTITLEDFEYLIKKFKAVEEKQMKEMFLVGVTLTDSEMAEKYYNARFKSE